MLTSRLSPNLVIVAAIFACGIAACGTTTYSCGTGDKNHCYGQVQWSGKPSGFAMELSAVPLQSGVIFIDDEGWLVDYFNPGSQTSVMSWAEAGEVNMFDETDYFWAYGSHYNPVTNDGTFMYYDLGPISSSDLYHATLIAYKVEQAPENPSNTNIWISKAATGKLLFTGSCGSCAMTPNTVIEGQELAGTGSGAQAPLAIFAYNSVINGSTQTFRTADGTVESDDPPKAGWLPGSKPSQKPAPNFTPAPGGVFFTYCCTP